MTFTGEYIDWDSTDAAFMGVPAATFSSGATTAKSAPNGRFSLCIPAADGTVDIEPAAISYRFGGTAVVKRVVIGLQPTQSYRSLTMTRANDLGISPTKAHVFIHVDGGARTVSTSIAAGMQKVFDGASWVDGNSGEDIFLGNIEAQPNTTLTVTGGDALGGGVIPLASGQFTYVTVIAR